MNFFWGIPLPSLQFEKSSAVFLRMLGLIYAIAFVSFGVQALGLIGSHGILPVCQALSDVRAYEENFFRSFPTLLWFTCSDRMIGLTWLAGFFLGIALLVGVRNWFVRLALFVLYLSAVTAGQIFMGYQWDGLLLETGFISIFLGWSSSVRWLLRWLLFRLMFMSGIVKLLSGDPTWRGLTALSYHYETQPLPAPLAWYVHQLPAWVQRWSTGATLFVELLVPFLLFFPRKIRAFGVCLLILFQLLIVSTGNYTFFNWLTIALCLFALDDSQLARLVPTRVFSRIRALPTSQNLPKNFVAVAVAILLFVLSLNSILRRTAGTSIPLAWQLNSFVGPFEISNNYGLFAVMTTERPEIILQGSNDGIAWVDYSFRYKPDNLAKRPSWVAPHQPRLDWQLWFAAFDTDRNSQWVLLFVRKLLLGEPTVLHLLKDNPFQRPPKYIRALLYDYRFATWAEHRKTGVWWNRKLERIYLPATQLSDFLPQSQQQSAPQ